MILIMWLPHNTLTHSVVILLMLSCAAAYTVPLAKASFLKFWWDAECQILKDESVGKRRTWVALGRPREGPVANAMSINSC